MAGDELTDMAEDELEEVGALRTLYNSVTSFKSKDQKEYMDEFLDDPACQPNYYEAGKTMGGVFSRLLMQKLEESQLP